MYINSIDMVWLLNVKLGAVQSTYMAKLEIENWSAAYHAHFRSISCAFSAAYRARTGPHHTVRIPQYMVRKFRRQWCGNSARSVHFRSISCDFRRSFCASARSCAEIPHGPIRKLASIWKIHLKIKQPWITLLLTE